MINVRLIISYVICLNLISLAISGPFIHELTAIHFIIAAGFSLQLILTLVLYINSRKVMLLFDVGVLLFFSYLLVNAVYSIFIGNEVNDIVRGIIPFIFLPLAYFSMSILDWGNAFRVIKVLFYLGVAGASLVVPFLVLLYTGVVSPDYRLTAFSDMAHMPILLISLVLMQVSVKSSVLRTFCTLLLFVALLATQSKGQVILGLLLLPALPWIYRGYPRWNIRVVGKYFSFSIVIISAAIFIKYLDLPILSRYTAENFVGGTTLHRIAEIQAAYAMFLDNIIFGQGAGAVFRFYSPLSYYLVEQRYVHNLFLYFLATGGIVGLIFYAQQFCQIIRLKLPSHYKKYSRSFSLSILVILMYGMVSASFKSIHVNVYLGILLGALSSLWHQSHVERNTL